MMEQWNDGDYRLQIEIERMKVEIGKQMNQKQRKQRTKEYAERFLKSAL